MEKFLIFTIVGLSLAAIYAVIASGLVLTYTTTGIFNFAHGAIGMLAAFTYWQLRFDWGWPAPVALFVVLLRRSRRCSGPARAGDHAGAGGHERGDEARRVDQPARRHDRPGQLDLGAGREPADGAASSRATRIDLGVTTITYHQAITIGVAILVAIGLRFLLYRTRIGVAMRANVDDRSLALLNGARPDRVAHAAAGPSAARWPRSAASSSPPAQPSTPVSLSLLIVNAYAAAIFGRLRSLPLTFLGAIVVGLTEGYLAGYLPGRQPVPGRPAARGLGDHPVPRRCWWCPTRGCAPAASCASSSRRRRRRALLLLAGLVIAGGVVHGHDPRATSTRSPTARSSRSASWPCRSCRSSGSPGRSRWRSSASPASARSAMAHHGVGRQPARRRPRASSSPPPSARWSRSRCCGCRASTWRWPPPPSRWPSTGGSSTCPTSTSARSTSASSSSARPRSPPLKLFGYTFDTPLVAAHARRGRVRRSWPCSSVAIRWTHASAGGSLAMRDSEAACATFGLNLVGTRLGGVHALGRHRRARWRALRHAARRRSRPSGSTSSPACRSSCSWWSAAPGSSVARSFAGDRPLRPPARSRRALGPTIAKINTVTPGLTGIGLGRNPSGACR